MRELEGRIKIGKLDGRFNGYGLFRYFVTTDTKPGMPFGYRGYIKLDHLTLREWCWSQWGPSCEWDMYWIMKTNDCHNTNWCWDADNHKVRILLADEEQAALLSLTFNVA